jgi:DNA-directed RNA polymerase subunit beta'
MEEPIRRMLGLTEKQLDAVLSGKQELHGMRGAKAIHAALAAINVDREIATAREQIKSGRSSFRDMAVRKLGYLKSAKKLGIHPAEWMLTKVPVLPPRFRPVAAMVDSGLPLVADANYLYKELVEANTNLKDMSDIVDDVSDERAAVYHTLKAVTGLGDPVHPKLKEKQIQGILRHIFGSQPKHSVMQRRLLSANVDMVGRGAAVPDPDLDMDHIGLPENQAWNVYSNFIKRRLRRRGMGLMEAARHTEERTQLAKDELLKEMSERPVIVNRAPVLHRFGIMAFFPKLTRGDVIRVSPLITGGFNLDFDGDAMNYSLPVAEDAKQEAIERMLPSANLLSPADFKTPVHKPSQEYTGGLYAASTMKSGKRPRVFRNVKDVAAAFARGEIDIRDPVETLT